jgi:hypothetical protein
MDNFPLPFSGISVVIDMSPFELATALMQLTDPRGCQSIGHQHNFAIEMDHWRGAHRPRIYTTRQGAECIERVLAAGRA